MSMHHRTSSGRKALMCLAVGSMFCFGISPAMAGGPGGGTKGTERSAGSSVAARAKAEAAKKKAVQQCCTRANKSLCQAVEQAGRAMRDALHTFHDATDDDAAATLTDDQVNALALVTQGQVGDALSAGMAAVMAAHDKALADLTAAGASQAMLDKLEQQTAAAKARLQAMADKAGQKLAEMLAEALAANDAPVPDPSGTGGGTEPTEPTEPAEPAGSHP